MGSRRRAGRKRGAELGVFLAGPGVFATVITVLLAAGTVRKGRAADAALQFSADG